MKSNSFVWMIVLVLVAVVVIGFGGKIAVEKITNKVADRVILRLQKEYSPSPYGPGIDPDKLDVEKIRKHQAEQP